MRLDNVPKEFKDRFWQDVERELAERGMPEPAAGIERYRKELERRLATMDRRLEDRRQEQTAREHRGELPQSPINDANRTDLLFHLSPADVADGIINLARRIEQAGEADFKFDETPDIPLSDMMLKTLSAMKELPHPSEGW